jgi:PrtD family type I secretion system ABC transporter
MPHSKDVSYPALNVLPSSWAGFRSVGFFSFFVNLGALTSPIYMQQIFDRVIQSRHLETLFFLTAIVVFFLAVFAVLDALRGRIIARIGHWWDETVHGDLIMAVVQLARSSGGAHNQVTNDLSSIRQFVGGPGVLPFFDAPWMPLFVVVIYLIHPLFGLAAVVAAVILLAIAIVNDIGTRHRMEGLGARQASIQNTLDVATRHADSVHSMGMLKGVLERMREDSTYVRDATLRAGRLTAATSAASKFIRYSAQISVLGIGAYLATIGEITSGAMIAASIILGRALAPAEQAMSAWRGMVGAMQAHKRVQQVLRNAPALESRTVQPAPTGEVEFCNATYYLRGSERPVLRNLNFKFEPGQVVAVVGASGSGKSTLCKMLIGALEPTSGSIRLNGVAISNWDPEQFASNVGYLSQSVQLLDGTIRDNIARMAEVDDYKVIDAAQTAGCHEMINQFPQSYDTRIGTGGTNLSGGQAQRIGLARAIYGGPRLVVLDEPNSNLDAAGDAACKAAIDKLRQSGTTVFIVSHKPAALSNVDLVVTLKDGTIAETQTREEYLRSAIGPVSDVLKRLKTASASNGVA